MLRFIVIARRQPGRLLFNFARCVQALTADSNSGAGLGPARRRRRRSCSVAVPAADGFSVSYTLANYQPLTVPVQVTHQPGDLTSPAATTVDPNPVVGELQPVTPPKPVRKKPRKPRAPKATAAPATAAPAASPFPDPAATPEPAPAH